MRRWLLLFLAVACAGAAHAWPERFDGEAGPGLPAGWRAAGTNWTVWGGALWRRGPGDRQIALIEKAGTGGEIALEATVVVRRRDGKQWAVAGLCIVQDVSNLWHFAFVEAPPEKGATHYVELLETFEGVRQAQYTGETKLTCYVQEGHQFAWEMNKPYRLRLTLRDGRIEGTVCDMDGVQRARIGYTLKDKSVRRGQAGAIVSNLVTVFDDFDVDVANP